MVQNNFKSYLIGIIIICLNAVPHTIFAQAPTFSMKIGNSDITGACVGIGITFTNTSSINPSKLKWDFGDNYTTTNTNSIPHTFGTSGLYTIKLTNLENNATSTKTITIYGNPTAAFSISDSLTCVGNNIKFTSTSTQGNAALKYYSWTFGDGNVRPLETSQTTSYSYNQDGTFVPILTVRDENGCSGTSTSTQKIKVNGSQLKSSFLANGSNFYSCDNSINLENTTNENGFPNVTYLWKFGDNTTSTEKSPKSHTYSKTGSYLISLQPNFAGISGCSPIYSKTVYIGQPKLKIVTPSTFCQNNEYPISATSDISGFINNPSDILWSVPSGITLNSDSTLLYANSEGAYAISVTNKNGCQSTSTQNITVNLNPTFNIDLFPNGGLCVGVETLGSVIPTNSVKISQYIWSPMASLSDTLTNSTYKYTYKTAGQYTYQVKAIGSNGCSSSQSTFLNIAAECIDNGLGSAYNPIFTFTSKGCSDKYTITVTNKNTSKPVSYWSIDNHQFNAINGEYAVIKLPFISKGYVYSVNTYFKDGSKDLNRKITIIDEDAKFTTINNDNSNLYCANNNFSFLTTDSINPTNIQSYEWNVIDDQGNSITSSNSPDFNFAFPKAGAYSISLTISDIRTPSCSSTITKKFDIMGISGDFTADKTSLCLLNPNINFQLNDISTPSKLSKVEWDFGDGNQVSYPNPQSNQIIDHKYFSDNATYNTYNISARIEDQMGCYIQLYKYHYINVYHPKIGFYKKDTILCNSKTITIENKSDAAAATYTWTVGDQTKTYYDYSSFSSTFDNISNPSELDVSLHLVDAGGCVKDTLVKGYIKYREPVAKYVISNIDALYNCPPFTLSIKNTSQNFDSSHWNINDDFSSIQKDSFYYTVLHPGPISITLNSVLDGCISNYDENYVVKGPVAKLLTIDTIGCTPYKTLLYLSDKTDIVSYQWDKGDGITYVTDKTSDSMRFTYDVAGSYHPSVTFVGKEGCTDRQEYASPIKALQSVNLKYKDNYLFCSNDSIIYLTASADNVTQYDWSQNPSTGFMSDTQGTSIGIIPTESTTYHVIAKSGNACPDESGKILVTTAVASVVNITPNNITQPAGTVFSFNPTITNDNLGVTYYWTPDYRLDNRYLKNPTVIADKDTTYRLNIKNENGCVSSDSIRVHVLCNSSKLLMANAFTPNGDGKNDRFFVTGYGIKNVIHFVLFDRWGKKVFERSNIAANDFSQGWDGNINNSAAAPGTYIYMADIECSEGNIIPLKGSVVLIR